MARNRANIEPGQSAWVGDLRFGPGQLLPLGTVEYQVKGFFMLEPEERWKGGPEGIPYSFTVPVGTSKADVQEMALTIVLHAIEDQSSFASPDIQDQVDLFSDIG